jgi:hypothetical protein
MLGDAVADEYTALPLGAPLFPADMPADQIVKRVGLVPDAIIRLAGQWERCGRNPFLFGSTGGQLRKSADGPVVEFLVPGVIPYGMVAELAARSEEGKSTLAHELAVAAGTPHSADYAPTWLGIAIETRRSGGIAAFISGEDSEAGLNLRLSILDPDIRSDSILQLTAEKSTYREILRDLYCLPDLRLAVIDPAIKFTEGSENESVDISAFFGALEDLARTKNCAVLVTHHLAKSARFRDTSDMRDKIRGSGVFVDRPRVVLGMYRTKNGLTMFGVIKHNLPPQCGMLRGEIALARDPATLRHLRIDQQAIVSIAAPAPSVQKPIERVQDDGPKDEAFVAAIRRLTSEGKVVTRSGRRGLYNWKPKELEGCSRTIVEAGVGALIEARIVRADQGRLSA